MLYFSGKGCSEFPKKLLILTGMNTQGNIARKIEAVVSEEH